MSLEFNSQYKNTIFSLQISHTIRLVQYFLVTTFCIFLLILLKLQPLADKWLNTYIIIALIIFFSTYLKIQFFFKYQQNIQYHLLKIFCFIFGLLMGGLNYFLNHYIQTNIFAITCIFSISCTITCLTFLTRRLNFFYLSALPLITPLLLFQSKFIDIKWSIFLQAVLFIALILAIPLYKYYKKIYLYHIKYKNILKNYKVQNQIVLKQQSQLLQLNQSTIKNEEKLIVQKKVIEMMHKLNSTKTWEWNLNKGFFTVTNGQDGTLKNDNSIESYLLKFMHPDDLPLALNQLKLHLNQKTPIFTAEYRARNPNGEGWIWVFNMGQVIKRNSENEATYMIGVIQNVEEQKQVQGQIQQSINILEHIELGIITFSPELEYVKVNPFFYNMVGLSPQQVIGKKIFEITDNSRPQQRGLHFSIIDQIFEKTYFQGEFDEHFIDGNYLSLRCQISAVKNTQGKIIHYVGIFSDITHYKQQEKRLSYLENYDVITHLPNRFAYNYKSYQFLITHRETIHQIAIIRVAIDRFNALHTFLGNQSTSLLLKQVAKRLRISNPNAFIIAYLDREDFVLLYELNHIQPSIQFLSEQINQAFSEPFTIKEHELILTVSIGISIYPDHSQNFEELNQQAEQALYHAQRLGGNSIQYYAKDQIYGEKPNIHLENEIYLGLKNEEFELYFQPKINIQTNTVFGFESLIRWNHPTRGFLLPDQFLPQIQHTSLMSEIGKYVIEKTVSQLKSWQDQNFAPIQISVNIDAQQLYRGQLLTHLDQALAQYEVSGEYLELEITESSLIENTEYVQKLLKQIKRRKIKLSLDDFGKGYSSLAYLIDFPFDILKIDRQFIQNVEKERNDAILNAIIGMGNAMALTLVAEGVETQAQLNYLQEKQCHIVQGYFFSKPLNTQDATTFMQKF